VKADPQTAIVPPDVPIVGFGAVGPKKPSPGFVLPIHASFTELISKSAISTDVLVGLLNVPETTLVDTGVTTMEVAVAAPSAGVVKLGDTSGASAVSRVPESTGQFDPLKVTISPLVPVKFIFSDPDPVTGDPVTAMAPQGEEEFSVSPTLVTVPLPPELPGL
jgi:hypothetical protein